MNLAILLLNLYYHRSPDLSVIIGLFHCHFAFQTCIYIGIYIMLPIAYESFAHLHIHQIFIAFIFIVKHEKDFKLFMLST